MGTKFRWLACDGAMGIQDTQTKDTLFRLHKEHLWPGVAMHGVRFCVTHQGHFQVKSCLDKLSGNIYLASAGRSLGPEAFFAHHGAFWSKALVPASSG